MCVIASVTRFGEILPLWQNLKETWLSFEGLFRKILNLLDKSFSIWQNLIVENSQPLNRQSMLKEKPTAERLFLSFTRKSKVSF